MIDGWMRNREMLQSGLGGSKAQSRQQVDGGVGTDLRHGGGCLGLHEA